MAAHAPWPAFSTRMVPWRSGDTWRRRHGASVPRLRFAPVARRGNQDSFANRDENLYQRFIQEAQAASALNHPYIVAVYDVGSHEGTRVHRPGTRRGRAAPRTGSLRLRAHQKVARPGNADRRRHRSRTRARHRSLRAEAREHHDHPPMSANQEQIRPWRWGGALAHAEAPASAVPSRMSCSDNFHPFHPVLRQN